jgi:Cu+-exporting ATPase
MHREYQPHAWHEPSQGSSTAKGRRPRPHETGLLTFTLVLGALIVADLVAASGNSTVPRGIAGLSWGWMAACLAGVRVCYEVLEKLLAGRIGVALALAQACLAAIVLREPLVAAEVIFISELGNLLEAIAAARAYRALGRLFEQIPRTARVERAGQFVEVPLDQVGIGDRVEVAPGERVPVDGRIAEGHSSVDLSSLTGESMPVDVAEGETVYTGSVNQFGRLVCVAEHVGKESTLGQVMELVRKAQARKAPIQRAADRYARLFLPVVEGVALVTLLAGWLLGWPDVWRRVVSILVVACPCALVLATPAAVLASMAWLARRGVLLKGGEALERLAACRTLVFDKTGTLTVGRPSFTMAEAAAGWDVDRMLTIAAGAERGSRHPLAAAVVEEAERRGLPSWESRGVELVPGLGLSGEVREPGGDWKTVFLGSPTAARERAGELPEPIATVLQAADAQGETAIVLVVEREIIGVIGLLDRARPEAHDVVHDLKHLGMTEVALLTGDRAATAARVARAVHVKTIEAELRPADKARWIEGRQAEGRKVVMVGDGMNDAPALAQADVGIAIAGPGSDLAAEAGDIVLMGPPLAVLPDLVGISRSTLSVIRQNIVGFAFGVNGLAMLAAALGWLGPIAGAVLHQGASLFVLLNALRLLGYGGWGVTGRERQRERVEQFLGRLDRRLSPAPLWAWLVRRRVSVFAGVALAAAGVWVASGFVALGPGEVGVVTRLGRYAGMLGPGPHLRWPPPLERVERVAVDLIRRAELGLWIDREAGMSRIGTPVRDEAASVMMTGDERFVQLSAVAQYRVRSDPDSVRRFVFESVDPERSVGVLLEAAIRTVASRSQQDAWLGAARVGLEASVRKSLQKLANQAGLGVEIAAVTFQETGPPLAVLAAFRDVSRAENEREARGKAAETYRLVRLQKARAEATVRTRSAETERAIAKVRAHGSADAFTALLPPRLTFERSTDARLFADRIEATFRDRPKLILDEDPAGRRHVILPESSAEANRWIERAWQWFGGTR